MPDDFESYEVADYLGGLDTTTGVDNNAASHAGLLRELARNGHRMVSKRDTVYGYSWDGRGATGEFEFTGGLTRREGYVIPTAIKWSAIWPEPVRCAKTPGHNRLDFRAIVRAKTVDLRGGAIFFSMVDQANPWATPTDGAANVVSFDGAGDDFLMVKVEGLVTTDRPYVLLNFIVRGTTGVVDDLAAILGYVGNNEIIVEQPNLSSDEVLKGAAISLWSPFPIGNATVWGPYTVLDGPKEVPDPRDNADTAFSHALDVEIIPGAARRNAIFARMHDLPRFELISIVVESYRVQE